MTTSAMSQRRYWQRIAHFILLSSLSAFFTSGLTGCVAQQAKDPIAAMLDRESSFDRRRAAMAQAQRELPGDPRRIDALHEILWDTRSPRYPHWQQKAAIDELVARDEREFRQVLYRRINLIRDMETLKYLFGMAVDRHWQDMTPAIVRSYVRPARGVADRDRPERETLEKLNPGKNIEQVVFETFANAEDQVTPEQQAAAWELLNRLTTQDQLLRYLAAAPDSTALVIDLKAAGRDLQTLPRNRENVLWLAYLRDPGRVDLWNRIKARVVQLTEEQRQGLQLRHLPVLLQLDDQTLSLDREALYQRVRTQVHAGEHHLKTPTYDGGSKDYAQQIAQWADRLVWADLATIQLLMRAVNEPAVVRTLFEQADADYNDNSTEYGGVIDRVETGYRATLYKPALRQHDLKFYPREEMIEHCYTGLAHYHFHAQLLKNSEYAGPGRGDLQSADVLHFNFLVFTFIDQNRLNIDYYQPGGVVVDLGTIRR